MRMEKKQITKEDGRYLVYYHFPGGASPEQTKAFGMVEASVEEVATGAKAPTTETPRKEAARV